MKRNIVLCIVLSIVTCGIHCIYWMIVMNNEINRISEHPNDTSGGMVVLFSIITCGIYEFFWYYKMGQKCDEIKVKQGGTSQSFGVLYLLLGIFGLGIVDYILMQDTINKSVA